MKDLRNLIYQLYPDYDLDYYPYMQEKYGTTSTTVGNAIKNNLIERIEQTDRE